MDAGLEALFNNGELLKIIQDEQNLLWRPYLTFRVKGFDIVV